MIKSLLLLFWPKEGTRRCVMSLLCISSGPALISLAFSGSAGSINSGTNGLKDIVYSTLSHAHQNWVEPGLVNLGSTRFSEFHSHAPLSRALCRLVASVIAKMAYKDGLLVAILFTFLWLQWRRTLRRKTHLSREAARSSEEFWGGCSAFAGVDCSGWSGSTTWLPGSTFSGSLDGPWPIQALPYVMWTHWSPLQIPWM